MRRLLILSVLMTLGVLVRLHGVGVVLAGDSVQLIGNDGFYHARRISQSFPKLPPRHDRLVNHPFAYPVLWPPGFDYLAGALCALSGQTPEYIGTLLVVLFGALLALPLYLLTRQLGASEAGGYLSAGIGLMFPILIEYSRIGRLDHHVLEPLVTALGAALLLKLCREQAGIRDALFAGLALGGGLWLWPSALLAIAILSIGLCIGLIILRRPVATRRGMLAYLVALLLALPLPFVIAPEHRLSVQAPSLLHVAFLLGVLSFLITLSGLQRRRYHLRTYAALVAMFAMSHIAAFLLIFGNKIAPGLQFAGRSGIYALLLEQRPIVALPLAHVTLIGSYLLYVLPLLAAFAIYDLRQKHQLLSVLPALIWLALLAPLGLLQLRFLPLFVAVALPFAALGLLVLTERACARLETPHRQTLQLTIASLAALALLSPVWQYLEQAPLPDQKQQARVAAARYLALQTSQGAVLGPISIGHHIVRIAQKPVVATPLVEPLTEAAIRQVFEFQATENDARAYLIARQRGVTWVISEPFPKRRFERFRALLGLKNGRYHKSLGYRLWRGHPPRWLTPRWQSREIVGWGRILIYRLRVQSETRVHMRTDDKGNS